jgi:hypothetical protein
MIEPGRDPADYNAYFDLHPGGWHFVALPDACYRVSAFDPVRVDSAACRERGL